MRALAEQLLDLLEVRPGDVACDLLCDGGTVTAALGAAGVQVVAVDVRSHLIEIAAGEATATGAVRGSLTDGRRIELEDAGCALVASLLTLGFGDVARLLGESARLLRPGGRMAIAVWDAEHPPPHERALRDALASAGHDSAFLRGVLPSLDSAHATAVRRFHDVARFDGSAHAWAALVDDRPLGDEVAKLSQTVVDEVRRQFDEALGGFAGADGTLRIPVEALVLS